LSEVLGTGFSSKVYLGNKSSTGEKVAIKVIDMNEIKNEVTLHLLNSEINVLKRMKNPYVLQLFDII
jgi:serine/threonine protein kinase